PEVRNDPIAQFNHLAGDFGVTAFVRLVQRTAAQEKEEREQRQRRQPRPLARRVHVWNHQRFLVLARQSCKPGLAAAQRSPPIRQRFVARKRTLYFIRFSSAARLNHQRSFADAKTNCKFRKVHRARCSRILCTFLQWRASLWEMNEFMPMKTTMHFSTASALWVMLLAAATAGCST